MKLSDQLALTIRDANKGVDGISTIILLGEPGVGKTFTAEVMMTLFKAKHKVFFQLYEGVENEKILNDINIRQLVAAMVQKENWKGDINDIIQDGFLYKLAKASWSGKVVGILDEIDKADESTDILLLDFIQNGRISDPSIKNIEGNDYVFDGVMYANINNIALAITSNELRMLNLALLRRCRKVRMSYPTAEEIFKIIKLKVPEITEELGKKRILEVIKISDAYRAKKPIVKSNPATIYRVIHDLQAFYKKGKTDENAIRLIDSLKAWFTDKAKDEVIIDKLKIDNKELKSFIKSNILE
jgi:MoxR-like ATPase